MKIRYALFLLALLPYQLLTAQNYRVIDSLQNRLIHAKDHSKVEALTELAWEYRSIHPDSAFYYAQQARQLAETINDQKGMATALMRLGIVYKNSGNYELAIDIYEQCLGIRNQLNDTSGMASCYNNMGTVYRNMGKPEQAISVLLESIKLRASIDDEKGTANPLFLLGTVYYDLEDYEHAKEYNQKALELYQKYAPLKVGRCFNEFAHLYYAQKNYSKAIEYHRKGYHFHLQNNDPMEAAASLLGIGQLQSEIGQHDSAFHYLNRCLDQATELNDSLLMGSALHSIGDVYSSRTLWQNAIDQYFLGLTIGQRLNSLPLINGSSKRLSIAYENIGKLDSALRYAKVYSSSKDSILSKNSEWLALRSSTQYTYLKLVREQEKGQLTAELNAKKTKLQEEEHARLWTLFIGTIMLSVALIVMLYLSRQRQKAQLLLQQEQINQVLRQQEILILEAIRENEEETRQQIARDLHDRLGSMLSLARIHFSTIEDKIDSIKLQNKEQFKTALKLIDTACHEVREISHNMASGVLIHFGLVPALENLISNIRVGNQIIVNFHTHGIDKRLPGKTEIAIYRISQELLGNALKHANATEITFQLTRQNHDLNIMIEDNGKGFNPSTKKQGMGLKNLAARVDQLNGTYHIDSGKGNGTTITIDIPIDG